MPETSNYLDLSSGQQISPAKLRHALIDLFDENELRDLCFDLQVDYDSLPAVGKANKCREIIAYFQRRWQLNVLVVAVNKVRPNIVWANLVEEQVLSIVPISPPSTPIASLPSSGTDKENTVIIGQSLTSLIKLMRTPEIRSAIVAFQTDFQAASAQIDLMNDYKFIHDLMQQLENRYFLIYNEQERLPADDAAWDSIMLNEPELRVKIDDLIQAVKQATFATTEARWIEQLAKARDDIRLAVEEFNLDKLTASTRLLNRVLNRQPSRVNAQLVTTAGALRLDALVQALSTVKGKLTEGTQASTSFTRELISQFEEGLTALAKLDERLSYLVKEHNSFQEVDDELRRVEASLSQGIEELEDAWIDLALLTSQLYTGSTDDWAYEIERACLMLERALTEGAIVAIRRHFRRLRSQIGRRFRHIDLELLTLCQELRKVGESLDLLLRNFR